jgi:RNA polymerase primary sigma factor
MAPLALHPGLADWLRASCHYQPLAGSTVLQLARRIQRWQQWPGGAGAAPPAVAKSGSRARDHLVRHNLRLIVHTWGRMAAGAPSADAFQEAAIQLQRAAERFDPCRGITFATYATPWLRSAFLAHHDAGRPGAAHRPVRPLGSPAFQRAGPQLAWVAHKKNGQGPR